MAKTVTVDIGNGLRDGIGTAGTRLRVWMLRDRGAREIKIARTGRLAFVLDGTRHVYTVTPPRDYAESVAFETAGTVDSPLCRALADTEAK